MSQEPTIKCPDCGTEIKFTESIAAPFIESAKKDYEKRLGAIRVDFEKRENELKAREETVSRERQTLREQLDAMLIEERAKIATEEARRAKLALEGELNRTKQSMTELEAEIKSRDAKLAEAQKVQAEVLKKSRELDDQRRELDLSVEMRVQGELEKIREGARKDAEDQLGLKVAEKEQTIVSMRREIESLRQKADQGSQQLQGEVLELQLEALIGAKFPTDGIAAVAKGTHGGDILHSVAAAAGQTAGMILWESKRTKNWSDSWLTKMRDDVRAAKADVGVIVSYALPKGMDSFNLIDGVWVVHPRFAVPMAMALRQMIQNVASTRLSTVGVKSKQELMYTYLTSPQFKQRVEAIVEAFSTMKEDLAKERRTVEKQWAKRDAQLDRVLAATSGMYGDLQGIAGQSIPEIDALNAGALPLADAGE